MNASNVDQALTSPVALRKNSAGLVPVAVPIAVLVPRRRVGPAGGDHREAVDIDHPTFAELDELGPPDDLVHLHLVVIAGRHEAADARAAELLGRHAHPALDALEHHLLKT